MSSSSPTRTTTGETRISIHSPTRNRSTHISHFGITIPDDDDALNRSFDLQSQCDHSGVCLRWSYIHFRGIQLEHVVVTWSQAFISRRKRRQRLDQQCLC